jgi:uncharacterized protein
MPKRLLRKYIPSREWIMQQKALQIFGAWLHNPNLWHLNRRSVSGAFAVGLFSAILPMPFQTVPAALGAIAFRCNLPVALALTWISNPFSMAPLLYMQIELGYWVLRMNKPPLELTYDAVMAAFTTIWKPLIVGSIVLGAIFGVLGYATINATWRIYIFRHRRATLAARKARQTTID